MASQRFRSPTRHVILFLVLSVVFSAIPFLCALLLDKSSLPLAIVMAWYAAIPPIVLLILAWAMDRGEVNSLAAGGRMAVGVGIWFAVQALFASLVRVHILLRLFALPHTLSGGEGYLTGALLFLVGGGLLWRAGSRSSGGSFQRRHGAFLTAAVLLLAVALPVLGACFALTTTRSTDAIRVVPESPSQEEVFGYISDVYDFGIRRTGWHATELAKDYLVSQLNSFGVEDVRVEPYTFDFWEENSWGLTVGEGTEAWQPETYFYPYSGPTSADGVRAEFVYVGEPTEENFDAASVSGRIALVDLPAVEISWDRMKLFSFMAYDPDNSVAGWAHPYPIGWPAIRAYDLAEERGAVGLVSILHGYPEMGTFGYYAPYDGELRPMPSLYVLDKDAQRLIDQAQTGATTAHLTLDAEVSPGGGTAWTVYGVLPGQREDVVMLHTHYDAPWQSGVEDSSGIGMVLGLARYYAQIPPDQREHTMVFFFGGSHMIGAPSNYDFIDAHADDLLSDLVIDIAIEHIADDYNPAGQSSGQAEPRGTFILENPVLVSIYADTIADNRTHRMLIFPTGTPLGVPTDAQMFNNSGYPIASLIAGPVWLFDNDDTLERVAEEELAPMSAMYIDFIERLGRMPASLLHFNLNMWVEILTALALFALAVWGGKVDEKKSRND
jgi:hypothetical protein